MQGRPAKYVAVDAETEKCQFGHSNRKRPEFEEKLSEIENNLRDTSDASVVAGYFNFRASKWGSTSTGWCLTWPPD